MQYTFPIYDTDCFYPFNRVAEFEEVLDADTVDIKRLRKLCFNGEKLVVYFHRRDLSKARDCHPLPLYPKLTFIYLFSCTYV